MLRTTDCTGESNSKCCMIQTLPVLQSSYVRPGRSGPRRILLKSELHTADYTGCHFMLLESELHMSNYTVCYFMLLKSELHISNYTECYCMSHFK
jgi:hypothetical protein